MKIDRNEVLNRLARGRDKWFWGLACGIPSALLGGGWELRKIASADYVLALEHVNGPHTRIFEGDWHQRRIELGLEKRPEPDVTPEEDDAWDEKRMDAIGRNCHQPEVYEVTDVSKVDFDSSKSDGSTASYYELPEGCTELQDLISHRNLNAQDGEMFRAIYRKGRASHSDELRDAKKVLFYAQAEVDRLMKLSEGK